MRRMPAPWMKTTTTRIAMPRAICKRSKDVETTSTGNWANGSCGIMPSWSRTERRLRDASWVSVWLLHEVFVDGPAISGRNRDLPVFIAAASNVSAAAPQRDGDRRENGLPPELAKGVE